MTKQIRVASLMIALGWASAARADFLAEWNQIGSAAAATAGGNAGNGANTEARALAIEALAVNDAVVSITHGHAAYLGTIPYAGPASVEAAADQAAAEALIRLFPAQAATFQAHLATDLAAIPDGPARATGIAIGQAAADNLLAARAADGSAPSPAPTYLGGDAPGEWRPTPPSSPTTSAVQPFWAHVTPFVIASDDQFRPGPPPALTSQAYADALNEVKSVGAIASTTRTADQTQVAQFWYPSSTINWNDIARALIGNHNLSIDQEARAYALVNTALADSRVTAWDAKFTHDLWRPITAIQHADQDGNAATAADPGWSPLLPTPNHPSYIAGHGDSGGAAAEVLRELFGDDQTFTIGSSSTFLADPGTTRTFTSITQAEVENDNSRVWAGIHYRFDVETGDAVGREVGAYVVANALAVPQPSALVLLAIGGAGLIGLRRRARE